MLQHQQDYIFAWKIFIFVTVFRGRLVTGDLFSACHKTVLLHFADDCRNIAAILKSLLEKGYIFSTTGTL